MIKAIQEFWRKLKTATEWRIEIRVDDKGAWIYKNDELVVGIEWADIVEISAWKLDRLTYDPIYIYFRRSEDEKDGIGFEELVDGFDDLVEEMGKRYSIGHDWVTRVNKGAFAPNYEVLWKKEG